MSISKAIDVDQEGILENLCAYNHDWKSVIKESLNDCPINSKVKVKLKERGEIKMVATLETGGGGFENFPESLKVAKSDRNGLNMFGTGNTASLSLAKKCNSSYFIADTSKPHQCALFFSDKDVIPKESTHEYLNQQVRDYIYETYPDTRVKIHLENLPHAHRHYTENPDELLSLLDMKKYTYMKGKVVEELRSHLREDYCKPIQEKKIQIRLNDEKDPPLPPQPVINPEHAYDRLGFKKHVKFDILKARDRNSQVVFMYRDQHSTRILCKYSTKGIKPKRLFNNHNGDMIAKGEEVCQCEMIDTDKDKILDKTLQGYERNCIFIRVNGVLIARSRIPLNGWNNIRLLVNIPADSVFFQAQPNKSHSSLTDELVNILRNIISCIYTHGYKDNKPIWDDRTYMNEAATVIQSHIRRFIIQNKLRMGRVDDRGYEEYISVEEDNDDNDSDNDNDNDNNGDGLHRKDPIPETIRKRIFAENSTDIHKCQSKCVCCEGLIIQSAIYSCNKYECGHILSEKNGGQVQLDNLVPLCQSCNKGMSSNNLLEWTTRKWGEESRQVKSVTDYCTKHNKKLC
jgi:hypothetical protein